MPRIKGNEHYGSGEEPGVAYDPERIEYLLSQEDKSEAIQYMADYVSQTGLTKQERQAAYLELKNAFGLEPTNYDDPVNAERLHHHMPDNWEQFLQLGRAANAVHHQQDSEIMAFLSDDPDLSRKEMELAARDLFLAKSADQDLEKILQNQDPDQRAAAISSAAATYEDTLLDRRNMHDASASVIDAQSARYRAAFDQDDDPDYASAYRDQAEVLAQANVDRFLARKATENSYSADPEDYQIEKVSEEMLKLEYSLAETRIELNRQYSDQLREQGIEPIDDFAYVHELKSVVEIDPNDPDKAIMYTTWTGVPPFETQHEIELNVHDAQAAICNQAAEPSASYLPESQPNVNDFQNSYTHPEGITEAIAMFRQISSDGEATFAHMSAYYQGGGSYLVEMSFTADSDITVPGQTLRTTISADSAADFFQAVQQEWTSADPEETPLLELDFDGMTAYCSPQNQHTTIDPAIGGFYRIQQANEIYSTADEDGDPELHPEYLGYYRNVQSWWEDHRDDLPYDHQPIFLMELAEASGWDLDSAPFLYSDEPETDSDAIQDYTNNLLRSMLNTPFDWEQAVSRFQDANRRASEWEAVPA